ncbi:MAG: NAD(P)/FAD-dependent oxidoreductase [Candidatus Cyclobacteriaceae bacterium M3_2C_046]
MDINQLDQPAITHSESEINIPDNDLPRVIIIGGGFSGIELAKKLKTDKLQVVMLDRHNYHTFQPLLYQVATAGLEPDSIAGPLRKIIENNQNFFFRMAQVEKVDLAGKKVFTNIGALDFDYLVIANGSKTNYFGNEEIYQNAFPLKQIPQALDLRSHILQNFEKAVITSRGQELQKLLNFVIVGGGPTGVELAGALGELKKHVLPKDYPDLDLSLMNIYLVEGLPKLLPAMSDFAGQKADKYLKNLGVTIMTGQLVDHFDGEEVTLKDGQKIISSTLIWAAGVKGNILAGIPAECVEKGRIKVNQYNQMDCYDYVYAIGDIASQKTKGFPDGLPMLAPVAMQQGRHLAQNLLRLASEKPLQPFTYKDKGSMATVGRNKAVVNLPKQLNFGGFFAWFVWLFVHLFYIIGFRRKVIVFSNWIWNYFTYDRGTRLIIRPFIKEKSLTPKD